MAELWYDDITSDEAVALLGGSPLDVRTEAVHLLQELIRNKCQSFGDGLCKEEANIDTLLKFFKKYDIECQTYHRPDKPARLNLIASYGSGSPRVMLGPSHVDVVPAVEGPNWSAPPFSGDIVDGEVVGRGAVDMLNLVACQAVVFARLRKAKMKLKGTLLLLCKARMTLKGTLLFCAVSDEESGGGDGAKFLMEDPTLRQVFAADYTLTELGGMSIPNRYTTSTETSPLTLTQFVFAADYTLADLGGMPIPNRKGEPTLNFTQAVAEKGRMNLQITCGGRGGHGSIPLSADNALLRAARVALALQQYRPPVAAVQTARSLDMPWALKWALSFWPLVPLVIALLRRLGTPLAPMAHALTTMTISPNLVTGPSKSNVIPGEAVLTVDIRTLPGQDEAYILHHIHRALRRLSAGDRSKLSLKVEQFEMASRSPFDTPMWHAIEQAASTLFPGAKCIPVMLPGATDNRFFREHGGTRGAYGTGLLHLKFQFEVMLPGATDNRFFRKHGGTRGAYGAGLLCPCDTFGSVAARFHGDNERISVRSLWTAVQFFALVVARLMGGQS
ncbi:hypothetical protein JKP88DRAFT_319985 [Tribonema minus]|uniref:Peptidase M20 dimerisation domain-containing protein n=1 Tax=Tribonema minus TaxID=303371 RepID=A0A835YY18_9STRA|nr:hypothetical protein JKP88DRAFT_319985 [Tribonema minus]